MSFLREEDRADRVAIGVMTAWARADVGGAFSRSGASKAHELACRVLDSLMEQGTLEWAGLETEGTEEEPILKALLILSPSATSFSVRGRVGDMVPNMVPVIEVLHL